MKKLFFSLFLWLIGTGFLKAEIAYYVFVMFYGNDSEQLLTTIQVDQSLKARLEKNGLLILEGKDITVECDLNYYNETWCITDSAQRVIGISEIFPIGREISWFRISEYNGDFAIEAPGKDISLGFYKSNEDEWSAYDMELKKGKRFIFNFDGMTSKIGPEGVQFIVKRK